MRYPSHFQKWLIDKTEGYFIGFYIFAFRATEKNCEAVKTESLHCAKKYTLEIVGMKQYSHYSYLKTIWGLYVVHTILEVAIIINRFHTVFSVLGLSYS